MSSRNQNINFGFMFENQGKQVSYIDRPGTLIILPITFTGAIHDEVLTMSSPSIFNGPPIAFIPYSSVRNNNISSSLNIDFIEFSESVSLNNYYIKFRYDLEHTRPYISLAKSTNQGISSSTVVNCNFNVTRSFETTLINVNQSNNRIYVAESGRYDFSYNLWWDSMNNATGSTSTGSRESFLVKNGSGARMGNILVSGGVGAPQVAYQAASIFDLNSGSDFVVLQTWQTTGGVLHILGNQAKETTLQIKRIWNTSVFTASVSGILIGLAQN